MMGYPEMGEKYKKHTQLPYWRSNFLLFCRYWISGEILVFQVGQEWWINQNYHDSIMIIFSLLRNMRPHQTRYVLRPIQGKLSKPPLAHLEERTTIRIVVGYGVRGLDGGPIFYHSAAKLPLLTHFNEISE